MGPKKNLQQNTVCLEQPIYASQENFTHSLVVMVDTFIMSALDCPPLFGCEQPLMLFSLAKVCELFGSIRWTKQKVSIVLLTS